MGDTKNYNIENIGTAQFFNQSLDYQTLTERIAEKQEMVEYLQTTGKTERALKASDELAALVAQMEQLKEDVLRLYETFTKIEIDTERLAKAKAHFDKGEFREADAILDAAVMGQDLALLIARDQQLDDEKAAIAKDRGQLSNEYLVKARLRATFYKRPNRFVEACEHFESALSAVRTVEAIFRYALFLQNHNDFKRARFLYDEALRIYHELSKENPRTYLPSVATTLNNLANLQSVQNEYELAVSSYYEALRIYRELSKENPRTYLPAVAMTLNNLANLQSVQNEYELAVGSYDEALNIRRELAKDNPRTYLPDVAMTLNNLAILQKAQNEYEHAVRSYDEALKIYREFAEENPRTYLPYVAGTLNNLAILQKAQSKYELASTSNNEALLIRRELSKKNPRTYLPAVATTLNNLGLVQSVQNEYELAASSYYEALLIRRELSKKNPRTYLPYVATTLNNLAILQTAQNEYELAESSYDEALKIYREFVKENPCTYLPYVAGTIFNLSIFYFQVIPDAVKSIALAEEVIEIAQDFPQVPSVQRYAETAQKVLQANNTEENP